MITGHKYSLTLSVDACVITEKEIYQWRQEKLEVLSW